MVLPLPISRRVGVFHILRIVTDRGKLIDVIVFTDCRRPIYNNMAFDSVACADFHTIPDDGIRTDFDVVGKYRRLGYQRGRVNFHSCAPGAQVMSAVTTT
jgi:hypothetical protein